jgi:hypothetical protein
MKHINWKRLGQAALIAFVLAASVALIYLVAHVATVNATKTVQPSALNSCSLQESKPVLIVTLNGAGAAAMCSKIIDKSNGRYFTYYGEPPVSYDVMCAVTLKHIQYSVLDIVPVGIKPTTRYSYATVCTLLQNKHRLIGEGF